MPAPVEGCKVEVSSVDVTMFVVLGLRVEGSPV